MPSFFHSRIIKLTKPVHKKHRKYGAFRAGDERIELPLKVLETSVIPFDQSPVCCSPSIYNTNVGNCQ